MLWNDLPKNFGYLPVFSISHKELLVRHVREWKRFWKNFNIDVDSDELSKAIYSSLFYLTSNLPSLNSNLPNRQFYGLSPTGLGRGGRDLNDYEGHNFWDTEIFMLPPASLINSKWAKDLLHYRFIMLNAAKDYANASGYRGARYKTNDEKVMIVIDHKIND